ncbi:bifunctional phosphoribosylaminoimidazolecarboxamide formyltransferase/IMP cyclohydrolase [Peptoniphilus equinus]|uniref:Bifunctional purine biosynthesis protein PurH n=1 Tax=Peptoniphilus equinus TaxID=3016343 RepID=A0ABY7QTD3_9FIRM|nr:bifunctional phosphoribosylaminoimidazolecarboxamide formyltransferase/IMP cyclohydrolase [Peptoniphilus equinus]WBW50034.1 bifunctional phosphoribosylaminoimidazolecarboxamide formyltransferase/IMP cyclohydrolase [Peptoniphilus equinus]
MRALLSVYDKTGIVDFAKALEARGFELISTGGTYTALQEAGCNVTTVESVTGQREILGGRVKTLHPKIHGGILHRRDNPEDQQTVSDEGIASIDMVVNNLYPFEQTVARTTDHSEIIEMIDIGGPSMIRAAAKNYKDVYIVTDPADYDAVLDHLDDEDETYRAYLAHKAFATTARYDKAIDAYFARMTGGASDMDSAWDFTFSDTLRYGENPHQKAAFYQGRVIAPMAILHGKQLSYNNYNDLYAAVKAVKAFEEPTVVAVKHTNPCGIGSGDNLTEAYIKAYECDTESIFGGIIALNGVVDLRTAEEMNKIFLEVIMAEGFDEDAFALLSKKKNLRLIAIKNIREFQLPKQFKQTLNGVLVQDCDTEDYDELHVVSKAQPTEEELENLKFAFKAVKFAASNGVVLAKDKATYAIGQGQTKRAWAVEEVLDRTRDLEGVVLASDGFFFDDTIDLLSAYGVHAAISPGGSIHDDKVIAAADEAGMVLVFTHMRHFRH